MSSQSQSVVETHSAVKAAAGTLPKTWGSLSPGKAPWSGDGPRRPRNFSPSLAKMSLELDQEFWGDYKLTSDIPPIAGDL